MLIMPKNIEVSSFLINYFFLKAILHKNGRCLTQKRWSMFGEILEQKTCG